MRMFQVLVFIPDDPKLPEPWASYRGHYDTAIKTQVQIRDMRGLGLKVWPLDSAPGYKIRKAFRNMSKFAKVSTLRSRLYEDVPYKQAEKIG